MPRKLGPVLWKHLAKHQRWRRVAERLLRAQGLVRKTEKKKIVTFLVSFFPVQV